MNASKTRTWLVAIVAVCFFASVLHADTLRMKDGRTIQGKYLGGTDSQITFYTNGNLQHYAIADTDSITFGDQTSSAPAASSMNSAAPAPEASSNVAPSGSILVPAGTQLVVRMIDGVDSNQNKVGDSFQASLENPLTVNGTEVAPQGTTIYGKLEQVKSAGHIEGQSELRLGLTGIVINGATYNIATGDYSVQGKSRGKQSAERVGIGAGLGAVIGAIAGGGKGAAIGSVVGGGAGTAVQVMTQGQQVHVPSETVLNFSLEQPVNLPISNSMAPVH
jgi:hypothetical protein